MYENAIMVRDKTRIIRKKKKDGKKELEELMIKNKRFARNNHRAA
jgi:hypothetical protein